MKKPKKEEKKKVPKLAEVKCGPPPIAISYYSRPFREEKS